MGEETADTLEGAVLSAVQREHAFEIMWRLVDAIEAEPTYKRDNGRSFVLLRDFGGASGVIVHAANTTVVQFEGTDITLHAEMRVQDGFYRWTFDVFEDGPWFDRFRAAGA